MKNSQNDDIDEWALKSSVSLLKRSIADTEKELAVMFWKQALEEDASLAKVCDMAQFTEFYEPKYHIIAEGELGKRFKELMDEEMSKKSPK